MESLTLRPLKAADLEGASKLLTFLNPETPLQTIVERLHTILTNHTHYRIIGAFIGETLVGVASAWVATKIWCGLYLEIDNLVVAPTHRSMGVGRLLIQWLEALAAEEGCNMVVLDSYTENRASHRLYHRLGFEIWGFHFVKPIGYWKGTP
jgi:GNAT superfamily N-acetyltransferase